MCHVDDSVILGAWLQETDHKDIEDQVSVGGAYNFSHLLAKLAVMSYFIYKGQLGRSWLLVSSPY